MIENISNFSQTAYRAETFLVEIVFREILADSIYYRKIEKGLYIQGGANLAAANLAAKREKKLI